MGDQERGEDRDAELAGFEHEQLQGQPARLEFAEDVEVDALRHAEAEALDHAAVVVAGASAS